MAVVDNIKILELCYAALDEADRLEGVDNARSDVLVTLSASLMSAVAFGLRTRSITLKPDMQKIYVRLRTEMRQVGFQRVS